MKEEKKKSEFWETVKNLSALKAIFGGFVGGVLVIGSLALGVINPQIEKSIAAGIKTGFIPINNKLTEMQADMNKLSEEIADIKQSVADLTSNDYITIVYDVGKAWYKVINDPADIKPGELANVNSKWERVPNTMRTPILTEKIAAINKFILNNGG